MSIIIVKTIENYVYYSILKFKKILKTKELSYSKTKNLLHFNV